ncbi:MAG: hypothetical protein NVSMB6_27120 [Burkholderiaceae bacterium]
MVAYAFGGLSARIGGALRKRAQILWVNKCGRAADYDCAVQLVADHLDAASHKPDDRGKEFNDGTIELRNSRRQEG